ncbi:MAG TPA: M36 family metallopeptidase, partial [Vicinamibacterales bacterium]|nr:M36 family metallopeptidase [Vicinamibacterales bacterium]
RFPYASRRTTGPNGRPHNPLTFADIDGTQINLTDGAFPRGPIGVATAFQVHNIGEVWASMLFEVRALFIKRLGHTVGNQRFLQFVTDGMKLNPINPTFIQSRDSILAAANAGGGTAADIDDIWTGFATRGLGFSAQILNASTGSVVEAFDVPGIRANGLTLVGETIPNGAFDSGETVSVSLCITNTAASVSGVVTGTLMSGGGVQTPSGAQSYGTVAPAGNVCRTYTFVVGSACGQTLTATLQAQEAGGRTRMLTYSVGVGSLAPNFVESFDGVVAPALPAGWSSSTLSGTANLWATSLTTPHTAPNRVFTGDPATASDNVLVSAPIAVPAGTSALLFRNHYNTEAGASFYDGGVLEISINGGGFTDIITAGGSFASGGYNGTISNGFGNPLAGRQAWSGDSGGYILTQIMMPPAAAGQNAVLRWRMGTDTSVGDTGWAIDSVALFQIVCSNQAPVITAHPQSQTVMSGGTVTLTVSASGSGTVTYQWYRGASGDTSTPIGGAMSASYTSGPLVSPDNFWVQVANGVGTANSNTAVITIGPGLGVNMVQNGDFSGGAASWNVFEEPNIQWNITGGVFQYWRQNPGSGSTQAVVYQLTNQPVAARTPLQASFRVGNSSTARKRISVLIIDSDFSDITVCTFWLAPSTPLALYTMNTKTTKPWANAAIYFYAATKGQDGGFYQLDDVTLSYQPALPVDRTDCIDPTAPGPGGGLPGLDLLNNGHFQAGGLTGWTEFGSLQWQVGGGVFEFIRPVGLPTPAGVIYQNTGQAMGAGQILTATFRLGNTSAVRKRVTVLLQEADFSDLTACTFWLAPFQPLGSYSMVGFTTKAWTNATLAIYAASVGTQTWTQVDDVSFRTTPATTPFGTRCIEPAPSPFFEEGAGKSGGAATPASS